MTTGNAEVLEVKADVSELERLFSFIDQFCARSTIADTLKFKLFLVAEELAMNTISHGYRGAPAGAIVVTLTEMAPDVELRFEDEAPPFDILRDAREPDLSASIENRRIGGLGVHLIKALSRAAKYAHEGGRNVVRVTIGPDEES